MEFSSFETIERGKLRGTNRSWMLFSNDLGCLSSSNWGRFVPIGRPKTSATNVQIPFSQCKYLRADRRIFTL